MMYQFFDISTIPLQIVIISNYIKYHHDADLLQRMNYQKKGIFSQTLYFFSSP